MSKPKNIHAVELGRIGGKNGKGKSKARTSEQARNAALKRWNKEYFDGFTEREINSL